MLVTRAFTDLTPLEANLSCSGVSTSLAFCILRLNITVPPAAYELSPLTIAIPENFLPSIVISFRPLTLAELIPRSCKASTIGSPIA